MEDNPEFGNLEDAKEFVEIIEERVRESGINVFDNNTRTDTDSVIDDLRVCIAFFETNPEVEGVEGVNDLKVIAQDLIDRFIARPKPHKNTTPSQETDEDIDYFGPASQPDEDNSLDGGKSNKTKKSRKTKKAKKSRKIKKSKKSKKTKKSKKSKRSRK
jgi:hypothetical protein